MEILKTEMKKLLRSKLIVGGRREIRKKKIPSPLLARGLKKY